MLPKFYLILAKCENNGIGYKGALPWSLRKELAYFGRMTKDVNDTSKQNAVIMGRKTWESMPQNRQPLPGRLNVVLSKQTLNLDNALHCSSFQEFVNTLNSPEYNGKIETVWVIGGSQVYDSAVKEGLCHRIYMTTIYKEFPCDTFVNLNISEGFKEVEDPRVAKGRQQEDGIEYEFKVYERV